MMMNKKKIATVIVGNMGNMGAAKGSSDYSNDEYKKGGDDYDMAKEQCMKDFLEAVENKNPMGMSEALSRHYEASESMEGEGNPGNHGSY